jgi:transposase-like protein
LSEASQPTGRPGQAIVVAAVRVARGWDRPSCPRCGHCTVHRWGSFSGRRRYRCSGCSRTFSDLTGTAFAYSKRIELWPRFCAAMAVGQSIRKTARTVGIHPGTAFRWRHRICGGLLEQDPTSLNGVVDLGSFLMPFSEKGKRKLPRPPRLRGHVPRHLPFGVPHVSVMIACDELGGVAAEVCKALRPGRADWKDAFEARLESPIVITSRQGRMGPCAAFARDIGAKHRAASRPPRHRRYVKLLRTWLKRFRGVATKYLLHYLVWHRRLVVAQA